MNLIFFKFLLNFIYYYVKMLYFLPLELDLIICLLGLQQHALSHRSLGVQIHSLLIIL